MVNALQSTLGGGSPSVDAFVAKLNAAGSALTYSTYLGGGGSAEASAIAVDSAGNAYITGSAGGGFPTVKPLQATPTPSAGAFVAELNAAGSALVYSTYFGDESDNIYVDSGEVPAASAVAVDSAGNTYFAGGAGPIFPLANAIQTIAGSGFPQFGSAFLVKIGPADAAGLAIAPQRPSISRKCSSERPLCRKRLRCLRPAASL